MSIEVNVRKFGIKPEDIKLDLCGAVYGGFGKYEVELSAGKLIKYFQYRRKWCSFTFTEIRDFYQQNNWSWNEILYGLIPYMDEYTTYNPPVYIVHAGNSLMVTKEFVNRCSKNVLRNRV